MLTSAFYPPFLGWYFKGGGAQASTELILEVLGSQMTYAFLTYI